MDIQYFIIMAYGCNNPCMKNNFIFRSTQGTIGSCKSGKIDDGISLLISVSIFVSVIFGFMNTLMVTQNESHLVVLL